MNDQITAIIKYLGGAENITNVTNCMTRLRITVKNDDGLAEDDLKALDDVLGVVHRDMNKYEIVIGPGKCKRYADALHSMGIGAALYSAGKGNSIKSVMKIVGEIFIPMIPGVTSAGLCAGFASLIAAVYPDYVNNQTLSLIYQVLTLVSTSFMSYITAWAGYRAAEQSFSETCIICT